MITSSAEYDAIAEDLELALCRCYPRASVLSFYAAQRAGKHGSDMSEIWWATISSEAGTIERAVTIADLARRGTAAAWVASIKGQLDTGTRR